MNVVDKLKTQAIAAMNAVPRLDAGDQFKDAKGRTWTVIGHSKHFYIAKHRNGYKECFLKRDFAKTDRGFVCMGGEEDWNSKRQKKS